MALLEEKSRLIEFGAPGRTRTADHLVRRPSLDRSQVDDLQYNSLSDSSNISAGYVDLSACLLSVVTSNIRRDHNQFTSLLAPARWSVFNAAMMGHGAAVAVCSHSQSSAASTRSICSSAATFSLMLASRAPAILRMALRLPPCSSRKSSRISSRENPRFCERLMNRMRSIIAVGYRRTPLPLCGTANRFLRW